MTPAKDDEYQFWLGVRRVLLEWVDLIERYKLRTTPRTAELRKNSKDARIK